MIDNDYWNDHRYFLLPGKPLDKPTRLDLDLTKIKPYVETHRTERGAVFFPDLDTARQYMQGKRLTGYNVVMLPRPDGGYFQSICQHLGCNVVYCIHLVGTTFRRDVTEFALPTADDGQHRWKGKEQ